MLWAIFAIMILGTLGILLFPLLKGKKSEAPPRIDYDIVVYRNQLAEIDQEIERGLLTPEQAEAARAEVHRRMLAAEDAELKDRGKPVRVSSRYARYATIAAIALILPIGAAILYATLGSPHLEGKPYDWRAKNDPEFQAATEAEKLAQALKANPSAAGYKQLAGKYFKARNFPQAAAADRRAVELGATDSETWSELGESVVMSSGGAVAPEALVSFTNALSKDPQDQRARFYIGLAEAQIGNYKQAVAIWRDLERGAPADAGWLPLVQEQITTYSKEGKFDPNSVPPAPPSADVMQGAVKSMTDAVKQHSGNVVMPEAGKSQDDMIRGMVAKLAARMEKNPTDVAGWQRLAHAYKVLNQRDKARDAIKHAVELNPNDIGVLLGLAEIQMSNAAPGDDTNADFIATMRKILKIDANNVSALYYVGLAEQKAGHIEQAHEMWNKVLKVAPANDPLVVAIHNRLDLMAGKVKGHQ